MSYQTWRAEVPALEPLPLPPPSGPVPAGGGGGGSPVRPVGRSSERRAELVTLPDGMVVDANDVDAVADAVEHMTAIRDTAAAAGDYDAAAEAHELAEELSAREAELKCVDLSALHAREMAELMAANDALFSEFVAGWDEKLDAFAGSASDALDALRKAHAEEEQAWWDAREAEAGANKLSVRASALLLQKRKMEEQAVAAHLYQRAKQLQAEIRAIEEKEAAAAEHNRNVKLTRGVERLHARHATEEAALLTRINSKRDEGKRRRQSEYDALLARFHNAVTTLEAKHKAQLRASTASGPPATASGTRSGSTAHPKVELTATGWNPIISLPHRPSNSPCGSTRRGRSRGRGRGRGARRSVGAAGKTKTKAKTPRRGPRPPDAKVRGRRRRGSSVRSKTT